MLDYLKLMLPFKFMVFVILKPWLICFRHYLVTSKHILGDLVFVLVHLRLNNLVYYTLHVCHVVSYKFVIEHLHIYNVCKFFNVVNKYVKWPCTTWKDECFTLSKLWVLLGVAFKCLCPVNSSININVSIMQSHVNYIQVINNYYIVPNSNVYHRNTLICWTCI
jgi:hypothetical protein